MEIEIKLLKEAAVSSLFFFICKDMQCFSVDFR